MVSHMTGQFVHLHTHTRLSIGASTLMIQAGKKAPPKVVAKTKQHTTCGKIQIIVFINVLVKASFEDIGTKPKTFTKNS